MTCRQKLAREHTERINPYLVCGCEGCPSDYGYLDQPESCIDRNGPGVLCKDCWDREIPEEKKELTDSEILNILAGQSEGSTKTPTRIICISGKAQHGKDTVAKFLKESLEERGHTVLISHYGDLVKYVCETFFNWDGNKDAAGRTLLQHVGTDVIRAQSPDYWVEFVMSIIKHFPDKWEYVLIPDCRFPNEIDRLKDAGWSVIHVRVVRFDDDFVSPLTDEQKTHPSETALDNRVPDILIPNGSTLEILRRFVRKISEFMEV